MANAGLLGAAALAGRSSFGLLAGALLLESLARVAGAAGAWSFGVAASSGIAIAVGEGPAKGAAP